MAGTSASVHSCQTHVATFLSIADSRCDKIAESFQEHESVGLKTPNGTPADAETKVYIRQTVALEDEEDIGQVRIGSQGKANLKFYRQTAEGRLKKVDHFLKKHGPIIQEEYC